MKTATQRQTRGILQHLQTSPPALPGKQPILPLISLISRV